MKKNVCKETGRKKALLVGINQFKERVSPLNGCINDVLDIRAVLKEFYGFTNSDIHCLTGPRATKEAIISRLRMLAENSQPGDLVVFWLSSHGSQIRDRHGDEMNDHMDELVCPYDMDWDSGTYILDDEFKAICDIFKKGVLFEAGLDTCHSGTGMKNPGPTYYTDKGKYRKERYIPPPIDIVMRWEGEEQQLRKPKRIMRSLSIHDKVLWAGCKSNQTSSDAYFDKRYNGAFTYALTRIIRQYKGKISRKDLIDKVRKYLDGAGFEQIPQLEGTKTLYDKNIFTV
jgi:hypothetical protein